MADSVPYDLILDKSTRIAGDLVKQIAVLQAQVEVDSEEAKTLTGERDSLKAEVEHLRRENAQLELRIQTLISQIEAAPNQEGGHE